MLALSWNETRHERRHCQCNYSFAPIREIDKEKSKGKNSETADGKKWVKQ